MSYTSVFGGTTIVSSPVSLVAITLTEDITLNWPTEDVTTGNIAASIVEVTADAGLSIALPSGLRASPGQTVLFNNVGSHAFNVTNQSGSSTIINVTPGLSWVVYLVDNTTEDGTWRSYQLGASVSQAQAGALAGTGLVALGSLLFGDNPVLEISNNYTVGLSDRAYTLVWTGGAGTITLPPVSTAPNGFNIAIRNQGTGSVLLTPDGTELINDVNSAITLSIGDSCFLVDDATQWWTVGLGQNPVFALDFVTISIAGSGDYTLGNASASELNRIIYRLTGLLTGDRSVIVPSTLQQYWIDNQTTGAFAVTVGTLGQVTPPAVAQSNRLILYCDGTNVYNADTSTGIVPSGYGATLIVAASASAARGILGGTATGSALFIAATAAAARSTLNVYSQAEADAAAVAFAIAFSG